MQSVGKAVPSFQHHRPEREVDSRRGDRFGFWDAVKPVGLGGAFHHQQTAAFQQHGYLLIEAFVLEAKLTFRAEADRGNAGVFIQRFLVIAVPGHALATVLI